jgi:hypothetical protein
VSVCHHQLDIAVRVKPVSACVTCAPAEDVTVLLVSQAATDAADDAAGDEREGHEDDEAAAAPAATAAQRLLCNAHTPVHPPSCNCIVPPHSLLKPLAEILLALLELGETIQNNTTVVCVSARRGLSRYSQCGHSVLRLDTAEQVATLIVATAHDSLVMGAAAVVHVGLIVGGDGARVGEGHVRLGLALAALSQ